MQIHELQNSTSVFANDDFVMVSGATNNTRKMSKDALFEQTATNALTKGVAPAFSTETAYAVGDLCVKDGQLYKCTVAHTGAEEYPNSGLGLVRWGYDNTAAHNNMGSRLFYIE